MRVPALLTAPVSALSPRERRFYDWTSAFFLALVLLWAARLRFMWPAWPVADPDTWGYLHPGLNQLLGGPFEHTYGRSFVYPGFLYLLLKFTGDFRTITVAQHLLGLGTGALLWKAWRDWRAWWWFAPSRVPAWADILLGVGTAALYTGAPSVVHFEMQMRPEAVFPFVAAAQLCFLLLFLRTWYSEVRQPQRAAVWAGSGLFAAALAYELKPSFGLALGVAALPILWALVFPWRQEARARLRLAGASVAGGLAALVLLFLPEHELAKGDVLATLFLPETLLTVHALPINAQLQADVRAGADVPFGVDWLVPTARQLDREVHRAAEPSQRPYPTLGINPDYLMYNGESFCHWLNVTLTPQQIDRFCTFYFQRAWARQTAYMLEISWRQLRVFYAWPCPAFWPAQKLKVERYYNKTTDALAYPSYHAQIASYPPGDEYLDAAQKLCSSDEAFRWPPSMVNATIWGGRCFLPLLGLFVMGMVAAWWLPPKRRRPLWLAGGALLLTHGLLLGNCLTVALVHSFDVDRYSYNLLVYAGWTEVAALAWLYESGWAWADRRQDRARRILSGPATGPGDGLPMPKS